MLCNKRSHCNERPVYHDEEEPLLEKSHIARKTSMAKYKQVTHTHTHYTEVIQKASNPIMKHQRGNSVVLSTDLSQEAEVQISAPTLASD